LEIREKREGSTRTIEASARVTIEGIAQIIAIRENWLEEFDQL
jgi:hypothetical protein